LLEAQHAAQHPRPVSPVRAEEGENTSQTITPTSRVPTPTADLALERPIMQEPKDDSDDEESPQDRVNVVSPTPEMSGQATMPGTGVPEQVQPGDDSATADILESMQGALAADGDVAITAGGSTAGLKRATSGETSRLRGPRGARGPRPAPGRVPSHGQAGSVSGMTAVEMYGVGEGSQDGSSGRNSPAQGVGRSSPVPIGNSAGYAPRRGQGATNAGVVSGTPSD
jgi:hypothetical protein